MTHERAGWWWRLTSAGTATRAGIAVTVAAVLLMAAACSRNARDDARAPADSSAALLTPSADPVPKAVAEVGHHSENAYDMAKAADWTRARAATDSLRTAVALLPDAGAANADTGRSLRDTVKATTDILDQAVTSRDANGAMRAANLLTELGARLAAPYGPRTPAGVTLLDFYGRELELWAATPGRAAEDRLRETAEAVRRTWEEIRPQVLAKGGVSEAARFDSLVAQVSGANARAEYARLATPVLDQVDFLERVFVR